MGKKARSSSGFVLKHGPNKVKVSYLPNEVINILGKELISDGEFLYGFHQCWPPLIAINEEKGEHFETIVHEIGEYIRSEYGLSGMTHEQLSVFTKAMANIFKENRLHLKKMF